MDNLKPMTREESIISGNDLKPLNRHEYYLKYLKGNGGGGATGDGVMLLAPIKMEDIEAPISEQFEPNTDPYDAVEVFVETSTGAVMSAYAYHAIENADIEEPTAVVLEGEDEGVKNRTLALRWTTGSLYSAGPADTVEEPFWITVDKSFAVNITVDAEEEWAIFVIPQDVNLVYKVKEYPLD